MGRFQVMATLQAARAKMLGMNVAEAKSRGLNGAIFYAAAKRGFKHLGGMNEMSKLKIPEEKREGAERSFGTEYAGDEYACVLRIDGKKVFTIGEDVQTEEDFKQKIETRFGGRFRGAWQEALRTCQGCDKEVLVSRRDFYNKVYKPRGDELAEKWTEMAGKS
ncbi:MAG: hypothetical protein ACE5JA_00410 [bacterium]